MNCSPKLLCFLEHYRVSVSKQHAVLAEVFQIHLYVQSLEHMATIHLGIGFIITILNFIEQEKPFQGRKVLGKKREEFLLSAQVSFYFFPFFHQAKFWKMKYFHKAVFRPSFCRAEPTRMLDANHLSF